MSRCAKKEWFTFFNKIYSFSSRDSLYTLRVQKRYVNRLFSGKDEVLYVSMGESQVEFTRSEIINVIQQSFNSHTPISRYCNDKYAEFFI